MTPEDREKAARVLAACATTGMGERGEVAVNGDVWNDARDLATDVLTAYINEGMETRWDRNHWMVYCPNCRTKFRGPPVHAETDCHEELLRVQQKCYHLKEEVKKLRAATDAAELTKLRGEIGRYRQALSGIVYRCEKGELTLASARGLAQRALTDDPVWSKAQRRRRRFKIRQEQDQLDQPPKPPPPSPFPTRPVRQDQEGGES